MKKIASAASPRVVLDSNVWISALLVPHSLPACVGAFSISDRANGIISDYILFEIERSMSKPALRRNYDITERDIIRYLYSLRNQLDLVEPVECYFPIRDERDLPILGTALAGKADYLVTGDRDLLEDQKLIEWMKRKGVRIIAPAGFSATVMNLKEIKK